MADAVVRLGRRHLDIRQLEIERWREAGQRAAAGFGGLFIVILSGAQRSRRTSNFRERKRGQTRPLQGKVRGPSTSLGMTKGKWRIRRWCSTARL